MTYREALKSRLAAATKGPWFWEYDVNEGWKIYVVRPDGSPLYLMQFSFDEPSTRFAAHARTDVELLLAQLERAEAALGMGVRLAECLRNGTAHRWPGKPATFGELGDLALMDLRPALASLRAVLEAEEKKDG